MSRFVEEGVVAPGEGPASSGTEDVPAGEGDGQAPSGEAPGAEDAVADAASLQVELARTRARLKEVSAAFVRQRDDMAAFRERLERQAAAERANLRVDAVVALLDPLEQLRRSTDALDGDEAVPREHVTGLKMVYRAFLDGFRSLGMEEIGVVGERFDPALHHAIGEVTVDDPDQDGTVLEVHTLGYRVGDRMVRPARVVVGRFGGREGAS